MGGGITLVVAPTGSGKTLAAFLSPDRRPGVPLSRHGNRSLPAPADASPCCITRSKPSPSTSNATCASPLTGIGQVAARRGLPLPEISVAVRSGDTPASDRRIFAREGADILITTPESLFLLLTSRAREMLTNVRTVIVDEVHAVAGTKRGAHLAVSLDRLDALLDRPAQRVGLTVRPVEEVAGSSPAADPSQWSSRRPRNRSTSMSWCRSPSMSQLGTTTGDLTGKAAGEVRTSIWQCFFFFLFFAFFFFFFFFFY